MLSFSSSLHLRRGHSIRAASRRSGFVPELWSFHRVTHEDLSRRTNPNHAASADISQIEESITGHLSYALRVMFAFRQSFLAFISLHHAERSIPGSIRPVWEPEGAKRQREGAQFVESSG